MGDPAEAPVAEGPVEGEADGEVDNEAPYNDPSGGLGWLDPVVEADEAEEDEESF